jgi:ATP-dependent Clp protease ATP-binding subunit ClpA
VLEQERLDKYHTSDLKLSIVLIDEIEKSSDALWSLLLGILDNATLTLGDNRVVNFANTIIVMTSNLGAREMASKSIGFTGVPEEEKDNARLEQIAISAVKSKFSPEFLNRIQNIVTFHTLTQEQITQVLDIELETLRKQLENLGSDKQFSFVVSPKAKRTLISEGFDRTYGARSLKRTIERRITQPLAKLATSGQILAEDTVVVDDEGGENFTFWVHPTTAKKPEPEPLAPPVDGIDRHYREHNFS